ncbi:MAG: hypothetical protein F6K21_24485 [Symploca sp. SIO2D2]|nr:hypothetical protein [Symploca sp. SIO2D2]
MAQQNRDYLYGKFQQGAKPSEQDFRDLIDSTLNFQDDQIKRKDQELKVAAPLRVTTNPDDTEETLLKFYAGEENTWSINQKSGEDKVGFNISDANGASRLFIESEDGNVGIGTTEPSAPLQVKATKTSNPTNNGLSIYNSSSGEDQHAILGLRVAGKEGGKPFISWDVADESGWSMGIDNQDENKLKIAPNWADLTNSTLMTFDGQGRVGIGTTEPSAPLQVKATKETDPHKNGLYIYNPTNEENQHAILGLQVAGKKGGNPFISWDVKDDGTWSMGIDNQDGNKLKIAPTWKDLDNSTLMTFDGQGYVGIGTTNPQSKLQIGSDSKGIKFRDDGGGVDIDSLGTDLHINYDKKHSTKIGKLELNEKPIHVKRYPNIGDDTDYNTGYKTDEWICGIVGFHSGSSDIQEDDRGDIIKVYAYPNNGYWHIRADFRSEGDGENWTIYLLSIRTDIAVKYEF